MARKKTHEQYSIQVSNKMPEYIVIDAYVNDGVKIKHKHLSCGHVWEISPNNILHGYGCPKCSNESTGNTLRKSHLVYIKELANKCPDFEVQGTYIRSATKIKHKHVVCGYVWDIAPNTLLRTNGCPKCAHVLPLTVQEYRDIVRQLDDEYEVIGDYVNANFKIPHLHKVCGEMWDISPHKFLNGRRCSKCKESKGEKEVAKYLTSKGYSYQTQKRFVDCKFKNTLPFDFCVSLQGKSVLIEFDGELHYAESRFPNAAEIFKITKKRDQIKNDYCKAKGFHLIRIPYTERGKVASFLDVCLSESI
jgi:hypothetical protein